MAERTGRCLSALLIVAAVTIGTAAAAERPFRLVVGGDRPPALEGDLLRAQLAEELRAPVRLSADLGAAPDAGTIRVTTDAAGQLLSVTYSANDGRSVTRTVPAPASAGETSELAVLLAGNLARNQAAELLDAAGAAASESKSPPPPATPAPAPAPAAGPAEPTLLRASPPATTPRSMRIEREVWTSRLSLLNAGVRLSARHLYVLGNLSAHLDGGRALFGPGLAAGLAHPCGRLECGVDVGTAYLYGGPGPDGYTLNRLISRARGQVSVSVRPGLAVFAGGGYALTTRLTGAPYNVSQLELFAGVRL